MISVKSLEKYFNKGKQNEIHVIDDISVELPEKGMIAIFGQSGCGKTTLLNVLGGLDGFASGSVSIDGCDIRKDTDAVRNNYIGYIFQNYNLNKLESNFDNVADALRLCGMTDEEEISRRVMAALTNVGMDKYRKRTPDTLSGGQQQRIAIARAIVKNPRIILADEPTGNLDEANTLLIMDLLKEISRDHLVVLVTHEANLVDYYCDQVIELRDGKVVNIRDNGDANGYAAQNKNDIFLGELDRSVIGGDAARVEFFGETPAEPVHLRIVNKGGKIYLSVDTPKIQILDESSEVKLREGKYEENVRRAEKEAQIDMSALPPVEGRNFGKLFNFKNSLKTGYDANFNVKRKKSTKLLRICMALFAAVLVFMTAFFGTTVKDLADIRASYNHNIFYVYLDTNEACQKLASAVGSHGIDYYRLGSVWNSGDSELRFKTGFFETFEMDSYDLQFTTNAVLLDRSLIQGVKPVCGKVDGLTDEEIVLTTASADTLLENSSLGYITEYRDLIGVLSTNLSIRGKNLRIAGIVESDETAIYLSELALSRYLINNEFGMQVYPASDRGIELPEGQVMLFTYKVDPNDSEHRVGSQITIRGKNFTIGRIVSMNDNYESWLKANDVKKMQEGDWAAELVAAEHPELKRTDAEFYELVTKKSELAHFDYLAYYYSEIDTFLSDYYMLDQWNEYVWLAVERGSDIGKVKFFGDEYYYALRYREKNGRFPTTEELSPFIDVYIQENGFYEDEFWKEFEAAGGYDAMYNRSGSRQSEGYYLNEKDYVEITKSVGLSDTYAEGYRYYGGGGYYDKDGEYHESENETLRAACACCAAVHSTDLGDTERFLKQEFGDTEPIFSGIEPVFTPQNQYKSILTEHLREILTGLISMLAVLALMSVCMYFIMRSNLLSRIKEVGIYRAIGVSKKNLVYKFMVEALVLTTVTVFLGYLFSSLLVFAMIRMSPLMEMVFFYPFWMAAALCAVIYVICLLCGTIPVRTLLRRTPAEILSKYDI